MGQLYLNFSYWAVGSMHSPFGNWVGSECALNIRVEQRCMYEHSAMAVVCPLFKNGSEATIVIGMEFGTLRWGKVIKQKWNKIDTT